MITRYEEYINENVFDDVKGGYNKLKNKVLVAWDKLDFQKRETILRKILYYVRYGPFPIIVLFLVSIFCHMLHLIDLNELRKSGFYNLILIFWFIISWSWILIRSIRTTTIRRKMEELRRKMRPHINNFGNTVYAIIGDQSEIDKFIQKLKEDKIIDDGHYFNVDGVNVVDFSGKVKDNLKSDEEIQNLINQYKEVDPYGEEDWEEDKGVDNRNNRREYLISSKRSRMSDILSGLYKIRLKLIKDPIDFSDRYDELKINKSNIESRRKRYETDLEWFDDEIERLKRLKGSQ